MCEKLKSRFNREEEEEKEEIEGIDSKINRLKSIFVFAKEFNGIECKQISFYEDG